MLEKHRLYFSWRRHFRKDELEDWSWIDALDKALSGSIKFDDLDEVENKLQYALNVIKRIKEKDAND